MPQFPHRLLIAKICDRLSNDSVDSVVCHNHMSAELCHCTCRLPAHGVTSSACSLRATARIWLQRPCCAAAAAQQEAQPLSKRQQKKQQQQQQQAADKGGPAVAPRSSDFSRHACR